MAFKKKASVSKYEHIWKNEKVERVDGEIESLIKEIKDVKRNQRKILELEAQ